MHRLPIRTRPRFVSVALVSVCALTAITFPSVVSARTLVPQSSVEVTRWSTLPGSIPPGLRFARQIKQLPNTQQLGVTVTLRVRDTGALDRFLASVNDPTSPSYHHFLTTRQFAQQFAPDAATRARTTDWLKSQGLHIAGTSSNGLQISAGGPASAVQAAFGSPVFTFQKGSQTFIANTRALHVPGDVASSVVAVSGLTTVAQQHSTMRARLTGNLSPHGYNPSDLAHLYNLDPLRTQGLQGSGQTIALVSFADYTESDIAAYDAQYGISPGTLTRIAVSDGRNSGGGLGSRNGQDEAEADIELVHAISPRANVLVYEAPNSDAGALALYNQIVSENRAAVVSISWGGAESSFPTDELNAIHQSLQEGAAQGQTFFAASGDSGAYDAAGSGAADDTSLQVDFPASDPWVTGVGGTTLNASGTTYAGEVAWSDTSDARNPVGSGGGLSAIFARPSYQMGPGVDNQYSNGNRQVPDVAANADPNTGYAVYSVDTRNQPVWVMSGGTSGSTPIWAGFGALLNEALGHRVGFLNPALYALGQRASSFAQAPFHDVTQGDNLFYPATPGWDFATGWGSFDGAAFLADLRALPGTALAPTATPTATPRPTATATPTTAAAPSISIKQVLLLHSVNGKLKATSALKVGEKGTLVILYGTTHANSQPANGTVIVRQNGKALMTLTLTRTTYGGKPALKASVHFTSTKRIGTLLARVKVALGPVSSALTRTFKVIR